MALVLRCPLFRVSDLRSSTVLTFLSTETSPVLVLELLETGALDDHLQTVKGERSVKQLIRYILDVLAAMVYLSQRSFVHRDIAARNVLVSRTEQCKLSDFGLSRELDTPESTYVSTGGRVALKWAAPEAFGDHRFTSASDVWSFGVLMWEVLSFGEAPFDNLSVQRTVMYLAQGNRLDKPEICPPILYQFMRRCWLDKEDLRPTFSELHQLVISLQ
eukprot:m.60883 g.60883  ORF g.60883 m.60883 type:complete len:217 (+) comp34949_c0_seq12:1799-2449(+)